MLTETLFKNKTAVPEKLFAFGFSESKGTFCRSFPLCGGEFNMDVSVTLPNAVSSKITDSFGEEYILHLVPDSKGAFVGKIRTEYETVLSKLCENCFENDVFKADLSRLCIEYVREKYGAEPEYLWEKFPQNAVWRRADNKKWFGAILTVAQNKLGLQGDEIVEIIDLRAEPEKLPELVDGKRFFPGYHMNKKNWFTVLTDGSVPEKELFKLIDRSFDIAKKK